MKHRVILSLLTMLFCFMGASAQKEEIFEVKRHKYLYPFPKNITREEAEFKAEEEAKSDAAQTKIGTKVFAADNSYMDNANSYFNHISSSHLGADWIDCKVDAIEELEESGQYFLEITISGKFRKIERSRPNFKALLLRNGTEEHCADTEFRDGDRLFISFQGAEDGYLAVYAQLGDSVYCQLPTFDENVPSIKIKAHKRKVFLKNKKCITRTKSFESNIFYILYSRNEISNPVMNENVSSWKTRVISSKEFNEWLAEVHSCDADLQVRRELMTIKK